MYSPDFSSSQDPLDLSELFAGVQNGNYEELNLSSVGDWGIGANSKFTSEDTQQCLDPPLPNPHSSSPTAPGLPVLSTNSSKSSDNGPGDSKSNSNTNIGTNEFHNNQPLNHDMEQRLEIVLDKCFEAGFENFESLAIAYYTSNLDNASPVGHAQQLSRSRRIRGLLSALSDNSKLWSEREARPWQEEILKAAEAIYTSEMHNFQMHHASERMQHSAQLVQYFVSGHGNMQSEKLLHRDMQREVCNTFQVSYYCCCCCCCCC